MMDVEITLKIYIFLIFENEKINKNCNVMATCLLC